ncbi:MULTISPECIES: hypothetical protein [unclassified Sphingopyxis]|uniref:hypothetical protein n=1 Tax=unclassified Sphingopyxis TaxID=2614943 RepID=UPI000730623A|nr:MULTISPECIES: hypothetical protein [unclassified Sphingopyxis]KTE24455.1 hypothetical protein ATE61_13695 [Sphingopyxis sp. H057]KTE50983.1 hypothetical protein ATE69_17395 [Sphingopyxis sp. H071]KTE52126.1 hypothetical protein ATE64_12000 [Sphingopyxis sp. H073]KTE60541.1 hypothetical protein ATE66_08145 [Sphingopyxis sp. H107]KTE63870.1 hypothetical protein ATE65_13790 [Sphingopyxis sp. H100]
MALAAEKGTKSRDGKTYNRAVAANVKIWQGAFVALSATGYATPGAVATTLKADGIALSTVDNTGGAAGDKTVEVEKGVFQFKNSTAGDAIAIADIGNDCYIVDDETVAKTNGGATRSIAGKIADVDAQGVWVRIV